MADIALQTRPSLARRGSRLQWFTIVWNSLEYVVALFAGSMAGSVSLVAFGLDSLIEVTSGSARTNPGPSALPYLRLRSGARAAHAPRRQRQSQPLLRTLSQ